MAIKKGRGIAFALATLLSLGTPSVMGGNAQNTGSVDTHNGEVPTLTTDDTANKRDDEEVIELGEEENKTKKAIPGDTSINIDKVNPLTEIKDGDENIINLTCTYKNYFGEFPDDGSLSEFLPYWYGCHWFGEYGKVIKELKIGDKVRINGKVITIKKIYEVPKNISEMPTIVEAKKLTGWGTPILQTCMRDENTDTGKMKLACGDYEQQIETKTKNILTENAKKIFKAKYGLDIPDDELEVEFTEDGTFTRQIDKYNINTEWTSRKNYYSKDYPSDGSPLEWSAYWYNATGGSKFAQRMSKIDEVNTLIIDGKQITIEGKYSVSKDATIFDVRQLVGGFDRAIIQINSIDGIDIYYSTPMPEIKEEVTKEHISHQLYLTKKANGLTNVPDSEFRADVNLENYQVSVIRVRPKSNIGDDEETIELE